MAQTAGFSDRNLSPEAVAVHWDEVLAGSAESLIAHGTFDPTQWDVKPYHADKGGRAT